MKTLKKIALITVLAFGSLTLNAQQVPMYTHYMYNTLVINPAYAGSRDALTVTALHRSQWVGFSGAPMTQTLSLHAPLRNKHIGVGLSVMNDKIGPTNNTSIYGDFAFIMQMSEKSKLALGLSAGADIFQAELSSVALDQEDDPAFLHDNSNHITPNFGFGAYYYRERFYAGVSVPSLLENDYFENENGTTLIGKEKRHFYLIAGSLFNLSENLELKPTMLIKATGAAPIQADLTASFIIMKRLLLGGMFRTGDSFGILVGFDATEQLHLGYSYDWSYGLETMRYNGGSHELVLRYDFTFFDDKQIHSPRNF
ncbi:MAG: PorP/SprF family type IX secretion system membrane protein [Bacteroidota bacterium]